VPADFDGGGDDSLATYVQNGIAHVVTFVDEDHGRDIALVGVTNAAPIGSAKVDGDDFAEAWIRRGGVVIFPKLGEFLGLLTFKPPCDLVPVTSPVGLLSSKPDAGVQCRNENGAHIVATSSGTTRVLRLDGSQLVQVPGNPAPAPPGFSCGSLSRPPP
jgi:hypothetical protein